MENKAKVIDLRKRKAFKKYQRWFELYAKFLALFKKSPKKNKNLKGYKLDDIKTIKK